MRLNAQITTESTHSLHFSRGRERLTTRGHSPNNALDNMKVSYSFVDLSTIFQSVLSGNPMTRRTFKSLTYIVLVKFVYFRCVSSCFHPFSHSFLAHLSRRLIGELIVYPWSGVRRPSASVVVRRRRRPSSTMLKHLLLRNRLADQSQILCGASLGRGDEILFAASGSHDQDGRHAHIW